MSDKLDKPKVPAPANGGAGSEPPPDPSKRLASFRPPRDLSLIMPKKNKKIFTPNLNVKRSKNRGPPSVPEPTPKAVVTEKKEHKQKKKDYKNKLNPKFAITTGIFSEGLGKREGYPTRASSSRGYSDPAPKLEKPTLKAKAVKIDKKAEEKLLKSLFSDQDGSQLETEDFQNALELDAPVELPMDKEGWARNQMKVRWKIKEEVIVKQEPADDDYCPKTKKDDVKPKEGETTDDAALNETFARLLAKDNGLTLIQLPDTLPGFGRGADDPKEPSTSADASQPMDGKCTMSDLKDGLLGFLRIHKSGRITMKIGDTIFEVSSGTIPSFYQEVVSVAVDEPTQSANIIPLGPLNNKLNITPDWGKLFSKMTA